MEMPRPDGVWMMGGTSVQDERLRNLYENHGGDLRAYLQRRLGPEDSEDALAEVFATAWRRISGIPSGDEARFWLYGVARNVVRNANRSERRRTRLSVKLIGNADPAPSGPAETAVIRSEHDEVLAALSTLRAGDQEILRLHAWENLSRSEISRVLGISVPAVDMRLQRAVARMSTALATPNAGHATKRADTRGGKS
jgi:RNA polymerase sigma-70 factor (ECF subfamily)